MNHSPRRFWPRVRLWAPLINAALLVGLWIFESRVGEAFWVSGLLCYLPQHWVVLPTLLLLLASLSRKHFGRSAIYGLTLAWATHIFLGLQVPASTWSRADATPPRLKVRAMTYNILGAQRGFAGLAEAIRAQNPDVLFLEEAVVERAGAPDPVGVLHTILPGYHEARAGEVCIFSRFPVLAQAAHQFPNGAARFVLEAILDVNGTPVRVVCVHPYTITLRDALPLPYRISHSLKVRDGQVGVLLNVIDRPTSTWKGEWQAAPLLVAGDFNTPPRGRVYNALWARLSDSWREAGSGMGNTFSSSLPVVRIDYVWHSPQWTATRAEVINSRASDHKPLVVDLELR